MYGRGRSLEQETVTEQNRDREEKRGITLAVPGAEGACRGKNGKGCGCGHHEQNQNQNQNQTKGASTVLARRSHPGTERRLIAKAWNGAEKERGR